MKSKAFLAARIILGLMFLVFGLNGFLNFLPAPPMEPGKATDFIMALVNTGYMFPLIKGTEVVAGILLLIGYVPIALILLAPVVVNIALFHTVLAPDFKMFPIIIALGLFLAWEQKERYAPLFKK